MFTTERTLKALTEKVNATLAAGEDKFTITIKATGDEVFFTLCSDYGTPSKVEEVDYFLCECRFPWFSGRDLERIASDLNRWEELIAEEADDKRKLREYRNSPDFDWGFYSDWYKDVYGHRPSRQ